MSSPRHSPPPTSATPMPKGILKNSSERGPTSRSNTADFPPTSSSSATDDQGNRLQWDETNLTLHEIERENMEARMKIDEPKTPFVHSQELDSSSGMDFDLDGDAPSTPSTPSRATQPSAAELLAANTEANANLGRRHSQSGSGTVGLAVGLDAVDLVAEGGGAYGGGDNDSVSASGSSRGAIRSTSRSPSFSLPSSRRSSASRTSSRGATNGDSRSDVREEQRRRDGNEDEDMADGDVGAFEDEDEPNDPETKAKQEAFAAKRNQHYGNEAEAMKIAAALAARDEEDEDEDEDDDDDDEGGQVNINGGAPPVPSLPNGVH